MKIFRVSRNTIYNWLNNWESSGLVGLYNRDGRGRKKLFNPSQQEKIKVWVKQTPKNLRVVQEKIQKEWSIVASKDTIALSHQMPGHERSKNQKKSGWRTRRRSI